MTCLALAGKSTALGASGSAEPGSARLSRCRRYESARLPNPKLDSSRNSRRVRAGMRRLHENGFIILLWQFSLSAKFLAALCALRVFAVNSVLSFTAKAPSARRSIDEDEFVQIKGRQTQLNESR